MSITHEQAKFIVTQVSNQTLAKTMEMTAGFVEELEKAADIPSHAASIGCREAARRLMAITQAQPADSKLLEDLTRRIYEAVTPETVELGAEKLRQKLVAVIAAN